MGVFQGGWGQDHEAESRWANYTTGSSGGGEGWKAGALGEEALPTGVTYVHVFKHIF